MAKRKTIADVVTVLAEVFGRKCTETTIAAYVMALDDLSDEQVNAAGRSLLRSTREFMPTPGQVREVATTNGRGAEAACDAAWLVLDRAVRLCGPDKSVNFRDGLINAAVRLLGGWQRVCALEGENFDKWLRKDFNDKYTMLLAQPPAPDLTGYLPGNLERENAKWIGREYGAGGNKYQLPAPEPIGCPYQPLVLSAPPTAPALSERRAEAPRLGLKLATTP